MECQSVKVSSEVSSEVSKCRVKCRLAAFGLVGLLLGYSKAGGGGVTLNVQAMTGNQQGAQICAPSLRSAVVLKVRGLEH